MIMRKSKHSLMVDLLICSSFRHTTGSACSVTFFRARVSFWRRCWPFLQQHMPTWRSTWRSTEQYQGGLGLAPSAETVKSFFMLQGCLLELINLHVSTSKMKADLKHWKVDKSSDDRKCKAEFGREKYFRKQPWMSKCSQSHQSLHVNQSESVLTALQLANPTKKPKTSRRDGLLLINPRT